MQDERQQGDRTKGKTVHRLPVAGTTGVCPVQQIVGILDLPGLPETGAHHRCMSHGPGSEAVMNIKKWIPLVLITAVVLTVSWMTMMYIVALYILFGGGI